MDHDSACSRCENCLFLLRCRSRACGGLLDQRSDSIGLRDVHGVAALDLDHRGARPFGHGTLRVSGIALSSVAMRYQLGLALHAGSLILPLRAATPHGTWESAMNAAFRGPRLRRKWRETLPCRGTKAVLRRQYRRYRRPWWRVFHECGHRLTFIRGERRDVDETSHLRIVSGFSDHRSTVGVANENRRAVLCCQSSLGVRHVVFQRHRRILDDGDTVTVSRQGLVDAPPIQSRPQSHREPGQRCS